MTLIFPSPPPLTPDYLKVFQADLSRYFSTVNRSVKNLQIIGFALMLEKIRGIKANVYGLIYFTISVAKR